MKKILVVIVVILAVIAAIVAAVFYLTADVTRAGDSFFTLIRNGNAADAYRATAKEFQAATSEAQFLAFLKSSSIADFESAAWTSRSISNNVGELEGSIKTKGGGVVPVKIKFVKEGGKWKLLSIEKAAAGVVAGTGPPTVPADADMIALTDGSVLLLGRAVNANDFQGFYRASAKIWQNQTTPDALKEVFKSFIDQKIDLTVIEGRKPEYSEKAAIDESGRLILKGYYPVEPGRINFTLKYIQEEGQFKLIGINVSTDETPSSNKSVMPTESELIAMAHNAVSQLANAVAKDDFSELYGSISKRWQAQISREEMRNAFRVFMDKKIPLTVVEGKKPEFTSNPRLDDRGAIVMEGQYALKPFRVLFELEFANEESRWKLQAINVRTKED